MAASIRSIVRSPSRFFLVLQRIHQTQVTVGVLRAPVITPVIRNFFYSSKLLNLESSEKNDHGVESLKDLSRYKDKPWKYLESEEYIERYGSKPVWANYRRNHKGGIPPQKTRKTCIRRGKTCGNPCPICRDQNIIIHYQNVSLLQQFISPYTGFVYDPTRTGVCMRQQKRLNTAIETAKLHGLIPTQLPFVDYTGEDYSNSHGAVAHTPPPPSKTPDEPWYSWYGSIEPNEHELARVKKIYKAYLK
ncbi:28S ribosomal protein S18b, mitochondrial [Astyanax mexicanus]|uniref:Small ribosomal subunit protein mS40 n=1 Tax=Astyanax mexicanus TaxID=7994 RepID=A0A8B9KLY7_ASTMX|nr:28S ribosomal protein S18b, mitochondrial [Astyanax mexicanus]